MIKTYVLSATLFYLVVSIFGFFLAIGGQVGSNVWLSLWSNEVSAVGNVTNVGTAQRIATYGGLAAIQGKKV